MILHLVKHRRNQSDAYLIHICDSTLVAAEDVHLVHVQCLLLIDRHNDIVVCSVTDKVLWELMEPISSRLDAVRRFVSDLKPNLHYNIVPIVDPFGPAITDADLQGIVVSSETVRGANAINERRVTQVCYYV